MEGVGNGQKDQVDEFFQDKDMVRFVARLTMKYLVCGSCDIAGKKSKYEHGGEIFEDLKAG